MENSNSMKKTMKRTVGAICAAVIMLTALGSLAYADTLGTIYTWRSNDYKVGKFYFVPEVKRIYLYEEDGTPDFSFPLASSMEYARGVWGDEGIQTSLSAQNQLGIQSHCGTASVLSNNSYFAGTITSNTYGVTRHINRSLVGNYKYISPQNVTSYMDAYSESFAVIALVQRSTYTTNQVRHTATHELGHALGWYGHSTVSTDVMYAAPSWSLTLSAAEAEHLAQIY